jgi:hypothetical protein
MRASGDLSVTLIVRLNTSLPHDVHESQTEIQMKTAYLLELAELWAESKPGSVGGTRRTKAVALL